MNRIPEAPTPGTIEFTPLRNDGLPADDDESDGEEDYQVPPAIVWSLARVCRLIVATLAILACFLGATFLHRDRSTKKNQCDCDEPCDYVEDCSGSNYLWPEYCRRPKITPQEAADIASSLPPAFNFYVQDPCFAYHEVFKHGTCTAYGSQSYLDAAASAFMTVSPHINTLEELAGSIQLKDTLYKALGSSRNVSFSCDINCVLVDIFFCFSAHEARLGYPTSCPQAIRNQVYTGGCAHCDSIDLTNKSHHKLPKFVVENTPPAHGLRVQHSHPDFSLFLLALFWRHNESSSSPSNKRIFVHGLWPEFSNSMNASSLC